MVEFNVKAVKKSISKKFIVFSFNQKGLNASIRTFPCPEPRDFNNVLSHQGHDTNPS